MRVFNPDHFDSLTSRCPLNNGTSIPCLAFGTYKITEPGVAYQSVKSALELGYRHIDTAAFYKNEAEVGKAIRESGIPREEIFVTSKVWKTENTYEKVMAAFEATMQEIGLDYLDLYLVHWPSSYAFDDNWKETNREVWTAMMDIYKTGRVKAIGVSNFLVHHLETIMDMEMKPAVDQIEVNPGFLQKETVDYCQEKGILVEAWSPLGRGRSLTHPLLAGLGEKYGKTPAQITLRWELQHEIVALPKSVTPSRIKENSEIFDFELSEEDMKSIDELPEYGNSGHSPDAA